MAALDTLKTIAERRSIRSFRPDPIPAEHLRQILEAARQAPSAGNRQPWKFILVDDPALKARVAQACSEQDWMAEAAYIVAAVGLPPVQSRWYAVDTAIALDHLVLAAAALGYGTCWIGAFNEAEVKRLLKIPAEASVINLTPLGLPAETPGASRRKPIQELFSRNEFGAPLKL